MYYFDTYALVEMTHGNPAYEQYTRAEFITGVLNVGELYLALLRNHNKKTADYWLHFFMPIAIDAPLPTVITAASMRHELKKNFSFIDCISYTLAREKGLTFLTGDKEFKGLPGAEVVGV